jgi:hypothetical protein
MHSLSPAEQQDPGALHLRRLERAGVLVSCLEDGVVIYRYGGRPYFEPLPTEGTALS